MKGQLCSSLFHPGLWVMHPSLEMQWWERMVGGENDNSPKNLEGREKSRAGTITSLAKVPRKCQNKMCRLRSGNENPFLAALKQIPPLPCIHLRGISLPAILFSTVDSASNSASGFPSRLQVPGSGTGPRAHKRDGIAPLKPGSLLSGSRRRPTCKENSLIQRRVSTHAAEGPSQPLENVTSIHAFGCN